MPRSFYPDLQLFISVRFSVELFCFRVQKTCKILTNVYLAASWTFWCYVRKVQCRLGFKTAKETSALFQWRVFFSGLASLRWSSTRTFRFRFCCDNCAL